MHHVPRRCRRRCFMRASPALSLSLADPSLPLQPPDTARSPKATLTYVCGTNILGRTACEHASANLVQFDSIPPLVFSFSTASATTSSRFFFSSFFSASLSPDLHDPVSPRRTIDPRLTSFRAVSLNSIYGFSFFLSLSSLFSSSFLSSSEKGSIIVDLSMIIRDILVRRE